MDTTQLQAFLTEFQQTWLYLCIALIALDVSYLAVRVRWGNGSAENFRDYFFSRITVIFLLFVIGLVDQLLPNIPLLYMTSLFYAGTSLAHMIQGAQAENTQIAPSLTEAAGSLSRRRVPGETDESEPASPTADKKSS